nr:uncharacterized protein LOC124808994 isoform X4 [Hydra vulgaris]
MIPSTLEPIVCSEDWLKSSRSKTKRSKSNLCWQVNASCAVLTSNQPLIILSTVGAALSGCIAFVCSFISCFSLCNTEHVNTGFIIQQPSFIAVTPGSQYRQFFQTPDLFNQQLLYGGQAPVSFAETDNSNNNCYSTDRAPLIDNR